jgi:hypothetical protein
MRNFWKSGFFVVAIVFMIAWISVALVQGSGQQSGADNLCNSANCKPINAPEFPSVFLPITFIFGFLGVAILVKNIRDD